MTKNLLIDLLNENIINHNDKEEFKVLLTLNNNEALFLKNLRTSTELKKEIVFFISHIKKLSDESIKENALNTLMSLNEKDIEPYIKIIDKILKTDITSEFTVNIIKAIKENNNLITPFLTLINCNCTELFYNGLNYQAFKTLLSFKEAPQDVLNSLSTILTNENLIKSKWYSWVTYSFSEYIKNYDIINAMPGSFLFDENILKSKKYQEIFKNTYFNLRDSEQIFILNEIINETPSRKEYANKFLLQIIDILQTIKPEFQTLFLKIAKSKYFFSNEFCYIQSLENIKNINSYLYNDLYYEIVMEMPREKYNKRYEKFFRVLKSINSYPKFYAIFECMKDSDFKLCNYQDFILESLCKDLNPIHYDYPSLGILLNSTLLGNSNYINLITELHKINSEHRLKLLETITDKTYIPHTTEKYSTYLFTIDDELLLEEYINYLRDDNIADTEEEWLKIFKISKKIKNAKILEHYTKICETLLYQFENLERKNELLKTIVEIQDEEIMKYIENSIIKLLSLEVKYGNFKNEERDYRFQNIIGYLSKKDKTLISTFYNVIFNEDFYKLENYLFNINTLDKITNLESLQIIEKIIFTNLGKQIIDKIINIKDTYKLKVLELLINELTKSRLSEETKLEHIKSFMNTSQDENETIEKNRTLEKLITSSNNLIIRHKEKILKMVLTSNSNSEIREKINKDLLFSRNTKSDILEVLFELSIFPLTYPIEDMLTSLTREELIDILDKFDSEKEISGKEEVHRGLGN